MIVVQTQEEWVQFDETELARRCRRHPTVAMGRGLFLAPILTSNWSIEANTEQDRLAVEHVLKLKDDLLIAGARQCFDFGAAFWEYAVSDKSKGKWRMSLKPLLFDQCFVDPHTRKLHNYNVELSQYINLCTMSEVDSPYGESILSQAFPAYLSYVHLQGNYDRYIEKTSGTHWVLTYPIGTTTFDDGKGGVIIRNNRDIAKEILDAITSSSRIAVPVDPQLQSARMTIRTDNSADGLWSLKLHTDHGNIGTSYAEREKLLDTQLMRAVLLPERSATGGEGSKTDATAHGDMALLLIESWYLDFMRSVNSPYGPVQAALAINNRPLDGARITASPIARGDIHYYRSLINTVLNRVEDPRAAVDLVSLREKADLPFIRVNPEPAVNTPTEQMNVVFH